MPFNRPPTRINTRFAGFVGLQKRPFFGQVSLKVSLFGLEESNSSEARYKENTPPLLLCNGVLGASVKYLHNRENPENAEQIPSLPPIQ